MPIYYPFQSRAGTTESFNFLGTDRFMADIGEPLGIWSPTLCRVPEGPKWIRQNAYREPFHEVSPAEATDYFHRHPRYYHLPPGLPADLCKLLAGMPEQLAHDLRNTQPVGRPEIPSTPVETLSTPPVPPSVQSEAPPALPQAPSTPLDGERTGSASETARAVAIDYDDVAQRLAKESKPTQAALVRYMRDKDIAAVNRIARDVHGDEEASEGTMAKNAKRTSESLAGLGCPLSFRVAGGMMHKEISPE